ncbi:MAG: hypothetical protein KF724_10915 [Phycisphaeraceae bacterium]|nr:hypothetical protein [Phycisphaeraceae bacterium]
MTLFTNRLLALVTLALVAGCSSTPASGPDASPMTAALRETISPDEAVQRLLRGNERFVAGRPLHRDTIGEARASAGGQYPFAIILACIDSRSAPEVVFDQGIGDIFVPRVAGNYAPTDLIGSMEFAALVAGAKAIMVVGHTSCGAVMGACDGVQLGNLTTVIESIRPAVNSVPGFTGERTSANPAFVQAVAEQNVRLTVARIRAQSEIIRDLEREGRITVVGAMHDLSTGRVTLLN